MLVSVKSKKSSTGKLYSTFVLKATLKYLQAMRTSCLIVDPFLNTKYLLEYTDTKPKDKKYPVVFSADASALLTKLHTELYNELSELSYSSKCDLETLAETSSTETVYDYFGFMYRVVKNESAAICKKCPSIVDVSDDGYIVTNIINIVG